MTKKVWLATLATTLLVTSGCNDADFLTEVPRDFIGPENFFQNADDAIAALNGVYASFMTPAGYGADSYYGRDFYMMVEYPGEALTTRFGATHVRSQLDGFIYSPSSDQMFANVWGAAYRAIADANAVIVNVPGINNMSSTLRERVIAEARYLRATHYFNLIRLFAGSGAGAGVPLWLEEARPQGELERPRSPVGEVYAAIIADLEIAADALPDTYADLPGTNTGRATRGAANALLAKVHLQYALVHDAGASHLEASIDRARRVRDSGRYQLLPDFGRIFALDNEQNAEIIFSIQNIRVSGMGGRLAQHVAPQGSGLSGANTPGASFYAEWPFYRDWDDADTRKEATFLDAYDHPTHGWIEWSRPMPGLSNSQISQHLSNFGTPNGGPTPRKYIDPNAGTSAAEETDYILLRYADVLLMLAEAINEAQGPTAEAYTAVNMVRNRAGLSDLSGGLSQQAFREAVQIERRYELVLEGHTFFDMQRHWEWSKARVEAHMNMALPVAQGGQAINASPWNSSVPKNRTVPIPDHYRFFPVHPAVLSSNQALVQTPGW